MSLSGKIKLDEFNKIKTK